MYHLCLGSRRGDLFAINMVTECLASNGDAYVLLLLNLKRGQIWDLRQTRSSFRRMLDVMPLVVLWFLLTEYSYTRRPGSGRQGNTEVRKDRFSLNSIVADTRKQNLYH